MASKRPTMTAKNRLEHIRRESRDPSEKGFWFESLVMLLLKQLPDFEILDVWRWKEWPDREKTTGRNAKDLGIDLVAKHSDGMWIAIQCKCYEETDKVSESNIATFLAHSARDPFSMRWIVATCGWSKNAEDVIEQQKIPIRRIDFHAYDDVEMADNEVLQDVREPFDEQQEAIDQVTEKLDRRGQMIMACGTGKTFTALRISEKIVLDGGRILFLAPSISLISQTRREWLRYTNRPMRSLVVCSDRTSGGRHEEDLKITELECPVTTDPKEISAHMTKKGTVVVFCTYQSLKQISEAQIRHGAPDFDLTVADEAHRTTGAVRADSGSAFQLVHDDEKLRTDRRLYMTATQRIYTTTSKKANEKRGINAIDMDDTDTYGHELHRLTFREAVEKKRLSDYQVIVTAAPKGEIPPDLYDSIITTEDRRTISTNDMLRVLGTMYAIYAITDDNHSKILTKTIGFANSKIRSKMFTKLMEHPELHKIVESHRGKSPQLKAKHLDASSSALERRRELKALEDTGEDEPRVINNVRLFTEGVDVPSLDAVAFLDPRDSTVDVVQAVGRVMRWAKNKRRGYIIIPVVVEGDEDVATALENDPDGFDAIGRVLRALQSHDGRLPEDPYKFIKILDPRGVAETPDIGIESKLNLETLASKFYARITTSFGLGSRGTEVAGDIKWEVERAGQMFEKEGLGEALASTLNIKGTPTKHVCTIAALLVANACLLHRRLVGSRHMLGLTELNDVVGSKDPKTMLKSSWKAILKKDYAPIFDPALAVLGSLGDSKKIDDTISRIANCANTVADSLNEMGYDHSGPLYHSILGTAQSDGAYYTRSVAAFMLAELAVSAKWNSENVVKKLKIMDPACGTGTLLMAVLQVLKSRVGGGGAADCTAHWLRTCCAD